MAEAGAPAGQGPVLLDLGDGLGSLLVTAPAALDRAELEVRRSADDASRPGPAARPTAVHAQVWRRAVGGRTAHWAVFPGLPEGRYDIRRRPHGPVRLSAVVRSGQVTTSRWPDDW